MLAGLASAFLEELTSLPLSKYSYELNALQFDALKEMVLGMLHRVGDTSKAAWAYDFQGIENVLICVKCDIYLSYY